MRVIAGKYRSRRLQAPAGLATRPTSDKLRETLFNVLSSRIEGCRFADLYAGSGAVGIEAISRGARFVCMVEQAAGITRTIRTNLHDLGIASGYELQSGRTARWLERPQPGFDVIFLDPPYEAENEYAATLAALGGAACGLLAPEGIVVAEHRKKQPLRERYSSLLRYRVLEQGDAALSFFRQEIVSASAPDQEPEFPG